MGKAILSYTLNKNSNSDTDELILLTGSLRNIDNCTRLYSSVDEMRNSGEFKDRIDKFIERNVNYINNYNNGFEGEFAVSFIADSDKREDLPILLNDQKVIRTRTSALEDVKSEVEKTRKLLFTSKNKMFLTKMLQDDRFADTTDFNIKLKLPEYKEVMRKGFNPKLIDGEYYLTIHDVLEYMLNTSKIGLMRGLVEDSLEVWKENLLALDDEMLYYYSRHFRLAINDYDAKKVDKKLVKNLDANIGNVLELFQSGGGKIVHHPIAKKCKNMIKTKRMEESFA